MSRCDCGRLNAAHFLPFNVTLLCYVFVQIPLFAKEPVIEKEEPGNGNLLNSFVRNAHDVTILPVLLVRLLFKGKGKGSRHFL